MVLANERLMLEAMQEREAIIAIGSVHANTFAALRAVTLSAQRGEIPEDTEIGLRVTEECKLALDKMAGPDIYIGVRP